MTSSSSSSSNFSNFSCPRGESLLELRFNGSGMLDELVPRVNRTSQQTLFAVTHIENGTAVRSYLRTGDDPDVVDPRDGSVDARLCLPSLGCYGLADYTGIDPVFPSELERFRFRWNGTDLKHGRYNGGDDDDDNSDNDTQGDNKAPRTAVFPYFLWRDQHENEDDPDSYPGMDLDMLFTEFGGGCSSARLRAGPTRSCTRSGPLPGTRGRRTAGASNRREKKTRTGADEGRRSWDATTMAAAAAGAGRRTTSA